MRRPYPRILGIFTNYLDCCYDGFMKVSIKLFHMLMVISLAFLSLKPVLTSVSEKTTIPTAHYSTAANDCSSRSSVVSYCQVFSYYTLTENESFPAPYLFILTGALFFILIQLSSSSPISRLFRPPICLN